MLLCFLQAVAGIKNADKQTVAFLRQLTLVKNSIGFAGKIFKQKNEVGSNMTTC